MLAYGLEDRSNNNTIFEKLNTCIQQVALSPKHEFRLMPTQHAPTEERIRAIAISYARSPIQVCPHKTVPCCVPGKCRPPSNKVPCGPVQDPHPLLRAIGGLLQRVGNQQVAAAAASGGGGEAQQAAAAVVVEAALAMARVWILMRLQRGCLLRRRSCGAAPWTAANLMQMQRSRLSRRLVSQPAASARLATR